jgi:hypothetical protein
MILPGLTWFGATITGQPGYLVAQKLAPFGGKACLLLSKITRDWLPQLSGIPANQYTELFSFACNNKLTIKEALQKEQLIEIFQLPLSVQAYEQFLDLDATWGQIMVANTNDA